jgi:hypothetical protein
MIIQETRRAESDLVIPVIPGTNLLDSRAIEHQIKHGIIRALEDVCTEFAQETGDTPTSIFVTGTNQNYVRDILNEGIERYNKTITGSLKRKSLISYDQLPVIEFAGCPVIIRSHCGTNKMQCVIRCMDNDSADKKGSDD